ncbi:LacI family DNA-binding transcriptional regulator [Naasia sp. SYSU D00948]|uniref:LacI family DNA-binding transcriptional regulator n=1 Tax=Naasia sp. SYSU D00948 TaxID=2817379 RepID=UPI001B30FABC|nr:LacI family DNA-binding transcriptional regulator [Naasia sp. SYSU D00948]
MASGTFSRRVTAADIAKSLGVSRATVGFVLNNTPGQTISEGTRSRVLAEAERLGYRPHTAAQALARGRSRVVLLVLPDWPIEYSMGRNIEEASLALEEAGYSLVTYTRHDSSRTRPLWETLNPDVVMGMLPFAAADVESMRASGVPHILPSPDVPPSWEQGASVTVGPSLQVQHLVELGHRRLGFAASSDPRLSKLVEARSAAVRAEAARKGLPEVAELAVGIGDTSAAAGAVATWRADEVTAVVAYNDDVAAMVAGAAIRSGVSVPSELAIIGHDDSPLAGMFVPSLTSVHLDDAGFGRQLAAIALHAAEGLPLPDADPAFAARVVRREST